MKKLPVHLIPLTLATALFAGCGSGGGGSSLPAAALPATAPGAPASSGSGTVSIVVAIPAKTTASTKRLPQYLPSNVASMKVAISQGATQISSQTLGLLAGNPGCSATSPVTCSATFQVPIGNDTFDLTSYDASANAISHAQVTKAIVAGVNALPVTLNGIVHQLSIIPGLPDFSIYEGTTSKGITQTATIAALDVAGNTIVGAFDLPINITADGTLFAVAGGVATVTTSADTFQYGYNLPDPYTGSGTFSAGATYLAQPQIDNAKSLVMEAHQGQLALWYDFADTDASLFTAVAGKVAAWKDRGGSANVVSQALAAAQPSIAIGGFTHNPNQNTLQDLAFPAGACLASSTGFPAGDYTMFVVAIGSAAPGTLVGPFGTPATQSHSLTIPNASVIDLIDRGVLGTMQTALTFTTPNSYYVTAKVESSTNTATLWFHGLEVTGPAAGTPAAAAGTRDPGLALNAADGLCTGAAANSLGEVIVLDHAASDQERNSIAEYLHRKWDI